MRKRLIDRFLARYTEHTITRNFPNGGFITPKGAIIFAHLGNHEGFAQSVGGTVRGLVQSGMIRYHNTSNVNYPSMGADLPKTLTTEQYVTLQRVLRELRPEIISVSQVGRTNVKTWGHGAHWTHKQVMAYIKRGQH